MLINDGACSFEASTKQSYTLVVKLNGVAKISEETNLPVFARVVALFSLFHHAVL